MALWAILASPLMMSNNLERIGRAEREILLNPHVIAVNQDKLGKMGSMEKKTGDIELYSRPVLPTSGSHGSRVFAVVNRAEGGAPTHYTLNTADTDLNSSRGYYVTDLFDNNRLVSIIQPGDNITVDVNPSGVVLLKATVIGASQ